MVSFSQHSLSRRRPEIDAWTLIDLLTAIEQVIKVTSDLTLGHQNQLPSSRGRLFAPFLEGAMFGTSRNYQFLLVEIHCKSSIPYYILCPPNKFLYVLALSMMSELSCHSIALLDQSIFA